ncbi:hypothetical protein [Trueperella sp. LYQ141]|uniref:hypothetical protein n=1 Tax=Trueperella sp. LYQ141 TaxID=3391058 RepID=UPI003983D961
MPIANIDATNAPQYRKPQRQRTLHTIALRAYADVLCFTMFYSFVDSTLCVFLCLFLCLGVVELPV